MSTFCILTSILILYTSKHTEALCESKVFCQGKLLETVQMARIFPDSKTFVDMRMINDERTTLQKFEKFMTANHHRPKRKQVKRFVWENFENIEGLEDWVPPDFRKNPAFLKRIQDEKIKNFANRIVNVWPVLAKRVKQEVKDNPQLYSLLPVENGFIVPGGRFREFYYWDSYWIIKGLLLCEMYETTRGMLDNFLSMIKKYGFVPNGSRIYYLDRSQPPLLTLMVAAYVEATNDTEWLGKNIKTLEKELHFLIKTKVTQVRKNGTIYNLARYISYDGTPRPESYYEDVRTASSLPTNHQRGKLYANLKSAAESGWDFSSRWIIDKKGGTDANLTYTQTQRIIPVDLNSFLCQAFQKISKFYLLLGDSKKADFWLKKSNSWRRAIDEVFYHEEDGIWYDWDNYLNVPRRFFYPSNFAPLWSRAYDFSKSELLGRRAVEYLMNQGILEFDGGIPASLVETGEQWDYPNEWPPLQSIVILGLDKSGDLQAQRVAQELAQKWIYTNMLCFYETGRMFEKYSAQSSSKIGTGGEYDVQTGFGWTNGVLLELIDRFNTN